MNITILGASGRVGQLLTLQLLERGHTVNALVHSKPLNQISSPNFTTMKGDIHNLDDVKRAVSDCEIVVSTLGSWGTKTKDIVSIASKNVVLALDGQPNIKFVTVTGNAAKIPGEKLGLIGNINHLILKIVARKIVEDSENHLQTLANSKIDWVSIRCPIMTNGNASSYALRLMPTPPWATVRRKAVVSALVDVIENNSFSKQAPYISNK